jgi:hypothetical protein
MCSALWYDSNITRGEGRMKIKDGTKREAYSVRLNPDLVTELKHLAVDQKKTLSELIEEGIKTVLISARKAR